MPSSDDVDDICTDILEFLAENPRARDTLEGIAEWWLLKKDVQREIEKVRQALELLVERGRLSAQTGADGRVHYQVDPETTEPEER